MLYYWMSKVYKQRYAWTWNSDFTHLSSLISSFENCSKETYLMKLLHSIVING